MYIKYNNMLKSDYIYNDVRSCVVYLKKLNWCKKLLHVWQGDGIPGSFMSFLVKIIPNKPGVPEFHWIIINKKSKAFISVDYADDGRAALDSYLYEMNRWVDAVSKDIYATDIFPLKCNSRKSMLQFLNMELPKIAMFLGDKSE